MSDTQVYAFALGDKLNRLMISSDDIDEAHLYIKNIHESLSPTIKQALVFCAVVAYCRPFVKNRGTGASVMAPIKLSKHLTKEQIALHNKVLEMRSNVIAHAPYGTRLPRIVEETEISWGYITKPTIQFLDSIDLKEFEELCWSTYKACRIEAHSTWKEKRVQT